MTLEESMYELAKVLVSMPSDYKVDVNVKISINDEIPTLFTEYEIGNQMSYRRILDTKDGVVTSSIILWMPN